MNKADKRLIESIIAFAETLGWTRVEGGKHHKVRPADPDVMQVTVPMTGSDWRGAKNTIKLFQRAGLPIDNKGNPIPEDEREQWLADWRRDVRLHVLRAHR